MRYTRLHVENFGIHCGRAWDLAPGVQVIYGPNEAGKSTLLTLLRELLFRFDPRSPFRELSEGGALAAKVDFALADGRGGWFRRQKSTRDLITGETADGRPIDSQAALQQLCGDVDPLRYENLFAFSAQKLRDGQTSLKEAGLEESLFGGGFGDLTRFHRTETQLRDRMDKLFKDHGNARSQTINDLLSRLKTAQEALDQARLRPQQYDEKQSACEQHQAEIDRLAARIDALTREHRELQALRKALPEWRKLIDARQQRGRIAVPPAVNQSVAAQFRKVEAELARLESTLSELEQESLARPQLVPLSAEEQSLLDAADDITRATSHVPRMTEVSSVLPSLREKLGQCERTLAATAGGSRREQAPATREQKYALQTLVRETAEVSGQLRQLRQQCGEIDGPLTRMRLENEKPLPQPSAKVLDVLAEGARQWQAKRKVQSDLEAEVGQLQRSINQTSQQLSRVLSAPVDWSQPLALPLRPTVETYRDRWRTAEEGCARIQQRLDDAREQLRHSRQQLADHDRAAPVDDRSRLAELRSHRDAGWRLIQRRYLGTSAADDEVAALKAEIVAWTDGRPERLIELYEQSVAAADRQADAALDRAEWIARRDQLARQVADHELQCRTREAEHDAALTAREALQAEWRSEWARGGIEPRSPVEMLAWLDGVGSLMEQREVAAAKQQQQQARRREMEDFERELATVLPELPRSSPEGVVQGLKARADAAREGELRRQQLSAAIDELVLKSNRLQAELSAAEAQHRACHERLGSLLQDLNLPADWTLDALQDEFDRREQAEVARRELESTQAELQRAQHEWDEFQSSLRDVCRQAAPGLIDADPLAAAGELVERLRKARLRKEQNDALEKELEAQERVCRHRAEELRQKQDEQRGIGDSTGLHAPADLQEAVARFEDAAKLDDQIAVCQRDLRNILGDDWESLQERLHGRSEADLEAEIAAIEQQLPQLKQQQTQAIGQRGAIQQELDRLAETTDVLARAREVEALRAELAEAVHQWAPLALTAALMQRARERFAREQQPALLRGVAELFERITGGEHLGIRRALGDGKSGHALLIEGRDGRTRTAEQLSDGARAQLYLAIRLAYLRSYCAEREPLPVVMDDVLVEFDDDRARRALEVLREFSTHAQVLLLTHHERTVELWRGVQPDGVILDLRKDAADRTGSESFTRTAPRPRRRKSNRKPADGSLFPAAGE